MTLSPRLVGALSAIIAVGVLAVASLAWWQDGKATWDRAVRSAGNLRSAVANDISRTIEQYDLSLRGAVEGLQTPGVDELPAALRQNLLFDRAAGAEYLGAIIILDANGRITHDSASITPRPGDFSERDYFQIHKNNPHEGLYISTPFQGRFSNSGEVIALSRRISDKDGNFAGVVAGFLRIEYFGTRFSGLNLGEEDIIILFRDDGFVLMRLPDQEVYGGRDLSGSDNFIRIKKEGQGAFVGTSVLDGVDRLYSFETVGTLPLIVNIGVSLREIMAPWKEKTLIFAPLTLLLCGGLVALTFMFQRELQRRTLAEKELAGLAGTDALTGLPNRRAFDQALDMEWRSSLRAGLPLSLLFIDADFFKSFNDRFGHDVGDSVLRVLGATIDANIRRPRDRVARYGGEEFTVILPETKREGALMVAGKIRSAVQALRVPDVDAAPGAVTVSIGLACTIPNPDQTVSQLILAADAALYRAKEHGRNRIESDCDLVDLPPGTTPKLRAVTSP